MLPERSPLLSLSYATAEILINKRVYINNMAIELKKH